MYSIKIKNKSFDLPENWDEFEYGRFKELIDKKEEKLKTYELLSIVSGIPLHVIKKIRLDDIQKLMPLIDFFLKAELPEIEDSINEFEIEGEVYYLNEFKEDVHFEEWIDFRETDDIITKVAVMAKRKIGKKFETYDSYELEDRIKLFNKLDVITIKKIHNFFLNNWNRQNSVFQTSLMVHQALTLQRTFLNHLIKNGAGSQLYNKYQMAILSRKNKSLERNLMKYFGITNTQLKEIMLKMKPKELEKKLKELKTKANNV